MGRRTIIALLVALSVLVGRRRRRATRPRSRPAAGRPAAASSATPTPSSSRSATASPNLTSAAYVADIAMTGVPNPSATADATAQLAQDLKIHAEGAFSKDRHGGAEHLRHLRQRADDQRRAQGERERRVRRPHGSVVPGAARADRAVQAVRDDVAGRHHGQARRQPRRADQRAHAGRHRDDRRRRVLPHQRQARSRPGRAGHHRRASTRPSSRTRRRRRRPT